MRLAMAMLFISSLTSSATASVLHVPADYPTIGAATAVATSGDEVLVAPGTYHERFTLGPGQDGVKIHGESGPAVTIIDGGYTGSVVSITLVGPGTELSGFTITRGGHNVSVPPDLGAGIRLDRASLTIDDVIVTQCKANQGAIYSLNSPATITHSVITANVSQQGGGIYVQGGAPTVSADSITHNQAGTGAGIYSISTSAKFENNVVQGNIAVNDGSGGGAYVAQMTGGSFQNNVIDSNQGGRGAGIYVLGPATISGNTITSNRAFQDSEGGGIALGGGSPTVSNNTIANNTGWSGGGLYAATCSPVVENNVFRGNVAAGGGGAANLIYLTGGSFRNNQLISNQANVGGGLLIYTGTFSIQGNLFLQNTAAQGGGIYDYGDNTSLVEDNQFLSNSGAGGGIYLDRCKPTIHRNLFQDNDSPLGPGGGIYEFGASSTIAQNLLLRNHSGGHGGGVAMAGGSLVLTGNTIVLNNAVSGGNVYVEGQAVVTLSNNILSHSPQQGLFQNGANTVTLSCNDISNNAGGNYSGLANPTGTNGNISLDPLYCSLSALDVHLSSVSPCTAANAPAGCGLIGALDIGCETPVRTEVTTWGGLKARYR